ncbi:hypothetical protein BLA29_015518, partial [Euroglyphus maynei]
RISGAGVPSYPPHPPPHYPIQPLPPKPPQAQQQQYYNVQPPPAYHQHLQQRKLGNSGNGNGDGIAR